MFRRTGCSLQIKELVSTNFESSSVKAYNQTFSDKGSGVPPDGAHRECTHSQLMKLAHRLTFAGRWLDQIENHRDNTPMLMMFRHLRLAAPGTLFICEPNHSTGRQFSSLTKSNGESLRRSGLVLALASYTAHDGYA